MKLSRIGSLLIASLAVSFVWADPIIMDTLPKSAIFENGTLSVRGVGNGVVSATAEVAFTEPVKLSMKMRRVASSDAPGHFGIKLTGGDGFLAHFYSHSGINFISALHQGKTMISAGTTTPQSRNDLFPASASADWVNVELYIQPTLTEIHIAGTPRGMLLKNLLPIQRIGLYGYENDIEVKDLTWELLPKSEPLSTDPNPSFSLNFDKGLAAQMSSGDLAPSKMKAVDVVSGISGQAVRVGSRKNGAKSPAKLEYEVKGLFANHGTVMFWMKSDWDGPYTGDIKHYPMLRGFDAKGRERFFIRMKWWISCMFGRTGTLKSEELQNKSRGEWFCGDWNHVAVVWSDGGWCKVFFNGLPYTQPFGSNGKVLTNLDLKSVSRLVLASGPGQDLGAVFDELTVYRRPLDNGEIYDAYRHFMPIDLLIERSVIDADAPEAVVLLAAPGGHYMHPVPAERPLTTGTYNFHVQICDTNDLVVASKNFHTEITELTKLRMPVDGLPEGDYRVLCAIAQATNLPAVQRSFPLHAYRPKAAVPPSDDDLMLGKVLFEHNFTSTNGLLKAGDVTRIDSPIGSYLEAGDRPMNRFSFEIPFPEKYRDGRAVLLEMIWPDDKPRSMGFYMYPKRAHPFHRDRLGGGIQSGEEYPLTGKMQTTRYLFYPGTESYLFEARTMEQGLPAALARFRIYPIENDRLPALNVRVPKELPGRRFGYRDEDETFDQNLGWDYEDSKNVQTMTERLLDYLDYTGQNAWQYPFMRYTGYGFDMLGVRHDLYPYNAKAYPYMVEALGRRGVITIANINLYTLPEMKWLPDQMDEIVKREWALTKFNDLSNRKIRPNHAHPEIRAMFAQTVAEIARRFHALPGFGGVVMTPHLLGFYPSIDYGYDDFTVTQFSRETGIEIPAGTQKERKAFLCDASRIDVWEKWRVQQSVEFFRAICAELDRVNPGAKFYLNVSATPTEEELSVFDALKSIAGLALVPMRYYTNHRHGLHRGKPMDDRNERLYDPVLARKLMNGNLGFVDSFPKYFESFNGSLKNDVYASYFQNADVKPFGRYFLKELVFAVTSMDAQRILIGAQPLGTWGRDLETREFAQAYCALPALPFENAPGVQDPVTVRVLNTAEGSYLYAASMLWDTCDVILTLSGESPLEDLSTGESITGSRLALKAYQLRSFHSIDPRLKILAVETIVPKAVGRYAREQIGKVEQAVEWLSDDDIACEEATQAMVTMQELLLEGRFAELHRLLFSLAVRDAIGKSENISNFAEQAEMVQRGHYAVNCGSTEFFRSSSGTLFFPGQAVGKRNYGFVGSAKNVNRKVEGILHDDFELFMTEVYGLDAYRFKIEPGTYQVRLYLKAGYEPGFKPDTFVFSVEIQGKRVLENFDVVTACHSDFTNVVVKTFEGITVKEGWLTIRFISDADHDPSVKLVNAIEVIRQ